MICYTIDRFEGDIAVVELADGEFVNVPRKVLPAGAAEGDIIKAEIDTEEVKKVREQVRKMEGKLFID